MRTIAPAQQIVNPGFMIKSPLILLICLLPIAAISQKSLDFTVGVGATLLDLDGLIEKDEVSGSYATDWEVLSIGVSGQYFFASTGSMVIGGELMYHHLYWYQVKVPYGQTDIHREYSVSTVRITPILRFGGDRNFTFDIGPEFNFIDKLNLGLLLSANYYFPLSGKIDFPVKLRIDVINDLVITAPVSLNAGVRIKM